jgi:acyl carrier protein
MDDKQIYEKLTGIFRDVFDDDSIVLNPAMTAKDIPEWDSFNHINIITATEMALSIRFTSAEIERLANVGDFVGLIRKKL